VDPETPTATFATGNIVNIEDTVDVKRKGGIMFNEAEAPPRIFHFVDFQERAVLNIRRT
jgi:hypothetical protein